MRVKDMKPGTEYASCDGVLVIPETPLQRGWMEWISAKKDEEEGHYEFHQADELDPWGGCMDTRRPPEIGVLVRAYHADRDGNRVGEGKLEVMNPRDIKGLWLDFMVLHGQKVRDRAIDRERNEVVSRLGEQVREVIGGGLPYHGTASVDFHYGLLETSGYGNVEHVEHVDFTFTVEPDELPAFLAMFRRMNAKAKPIVDELQERHLTDAEWKRIQDDRGARPRRAKAKSRR